METATFANRNSQVYKHRVCTFGCAALYFEKKATHTVRFSVRNCTLNKDVKCITKHQYSSNLWPLKIKRNCIVDKSLAVRIVYLY